MRQFICEFFLNKKYDVKGPKLLRVENGEKILKQRANKIINLSCKYELYNITVSVDILGDDRLKFSFYVQNISSKLDENNIKSFIDSLEDVFEGIFEVDEDLHDFFEFNEKISITKKRQYCKKLIRVYNIMDDKELIEKLQKYIDEISK